MENVANLWWLWLIGALVTLLYGGYNQVRRMQGMWNGDGASFTKGLMPLFVAAILNMGFMVLLITAIVLLVIDHAKK